MEKLTEKQIELLRRAVLMTMTSEQKAIEFTTSEAAADAIRETINDYRILLNAFCAAECVTIC